MLAKELLNIDFTPLKPSSPISAALAKMDAWHAAAIPVVEPATRKVVGQLQFEDVAEVDDESAPVSSLTMRQPILIYENQHLFEVARLMLQHELRMVSVVDQSEGYLGIIEKKNVLEALSHMLNVTTAGSVITVEIQRGDFTLTELTHLIEMEGAKILGLTVEKAGNSEAYLHVSIKLNHRDTSAVTSSLKRHGYTTTTENRNDMIEMDLSSRADELLRYLDV